MAHFRFSFDRSWRDEGTLNASHREGWEPRLVSRRGAQPQGRSSSWGVVVLVSLATVNVGCASEAPLSAAGGAGAEDSTLDDRGEAPEKPQGSGSVAVGQEVQAPGNPAKGYPAAPYGTEQGATIADLELFGWRNPVAANFDVNAGETVRLSDFYNPNGASAAGTEYIMLNAVAAWCGVCRAEYQEIETADTYGELSARGLEMVGVLFEDNNGDPSTFQDMTNWARAYSVSFPFVNDPAFTTGVFFDKSATPMNMLIDARTMQIVTVMTGYNPMIYDQIDRLLTERGR